MDKYILKLSLFVAFIMLYGTAKAQVDMALIRQQIKYHKEWMKEHTPNPISLNDSALIIETVRAIHSVCHEPEVGAMIRYAGNKYGLRDLDDYADLRDKQNIDKDDAKATRCLELLAKEAHKRLGEASYAEAYSYMMLTMQASSYEQAKTYCWRFHDVAKPLYEHDSSTMNQELWLMAQVSVRTIEQYYAENPLIYRDMMMLTREISLFYKAHQLHTDTQVYLLKTIDNYFNNVGLYENYQAYVNRVLIRENLLQGDDNLGPEVFGLSCEDDDLLCVPTQLLARLLHPNHPDVMAMQADDYEMLWYGGEAFLQKLCFIKAFFREYQGGETIQTRAVKHAIRGWQMLHQRPIEDVNFQDDRNILNTYMTTTSEAAFMALADDIEFMLYSQSSLLEEMVASLDSLLIVVAGGDPIKKLLFNHYKVTLQRGGMPGHEYDFYDQAQEYLNCCENYPNWTTIALGKMMARDASFMGDASTALTLQRHVVSLLRTMQGEKDPIFVMEYLSYGQMARDNPNKKITTLDGQQGADSLYSDLIRCSSAADVEVNAYLCAGAYYCNSGQHQKGRDYLLKALTMLDSRAAQIAPTDTSFIESNRYDRATAYATLLNSVLRESSGNNYDYDRNAVEQYGKELEALIRDITFDPTQNFYCFNQLSEYYCIIGRFDLAKQLLHECLRYYDSLIGSRVDMPYLQILQTLINIAGLMENDMDECQSLAERLERDIDGFENMGSYENYIVLLRTLYDLVEAKNPYDLVLLNRYLTLYNEAVDKYWKASNNDDAVWFNHGLYYASKYLAFVSRHDQLRNMTIASGGDIDAFYRDWEQIKEKVNSFIAPELEKRRQQLEDTYSHSRQMPLSYYQIWMCQALAAEYCQQDVEFAEKCYRKVAEGMGGGLLHLGQFLLRHGREDEALDVYQRLDSLFHDPKGFDMKHPTVNLMGKANTAANICVGYYAVDQYEEALRLAYEFQGYMSAYIQQNFDLMTQNEREGFLSNNSSGSMPLLLLLPYMSERIAGDAYNAVLRDKGLLLRTTDRLQRAIAASGNETLIHAVDSLHLMQQQLSSIQSTTPEASVQFASLREQMDRLERYIARKSAPYRSKEDEISTWQQVRNQLRKGEVAVEYVMAADSMLMALLLTKECDKPQYVPIMNLKDLQELAAMMRDKTPSQLAGELYGEKHTYLYEKIWNPLEPFFNGATKIYFSPTGVLNSLSFAAITLPDGSYLIDHYELHQLTSTARIAYRSSKQVSKGKTLTANIYGALFYNDEQRAYYEPRLAEMRQSQQTGPYLAYTGKQRGQAESFPFLENSLYEADAITTLLTAKGVWANEQVGTEPTEQAFRRLDGNSADIILLSTHGFFYNNLRKACDIPYLQQRQNVLNAMTSTGLILADGERAWQGERMADDSDNVLSSSEVASMNLTNTRLAVLSACETGLGMSNNEGVYGLLRGFKQAGVSSICASLWSVNDLSTAQLMQLFFQHWLSDNKEMNMQRAMIEAMKEQRARTPEPYYWAPFVLYDADF